jgi:hypothetical protein
MKFLVAACLFLLIPAAQGNAANEREQLREFLESTISRATSFEDRFDAEVWLVDMSTRLERYVPDVDQRLELLELIHHFSSQSDLSPELVLSVIDVESRFDRFAVSRGGAQGLMQVMPFWKHEIGRPDDNLTDIRTAGPPHHGTGTVQRQRRQQRLPGSCGGSLAGTLENGAAELVLINWYRLARY